MFAKPLVCPLAVVICAVSLEASAADPGEEGHYLVAGYHNALPVPAAIASAGGVWTGQIESIGVALVTSTNPDFLRLVEKDHSVQFAAPDVEVSLPDSGVDPSVGEMAYVPQEALSGSNVGDAGSGLLSDDPLSVLEWDNAWLGLADVHARGITGEGVTIAVVDSGIDRTHPDLAQSVIATGISFLPDDPDPFPTGGTGHGTAVAGIIAATCDNGIGVCGVAPGARLLSVRISNGEEFPISRILEAYDWASSVGVSQYGVRIINASHGAFCSDEDPVCREEVVQLLGIANRMIAEVYRRGVVLFVAAGNQGVDVSRDDGFVSWPAGGKAETVGATGPCCSACDGDPLDDDDYDRFAPYSNHGFTDNYFVAPGGQRKLYCAYPKPNVCTVPSPFGPLTGHCQVFDMIWTTTILNPAFVAGRYGPFSGTSASTPEASGLAALWLSRYPDLGVGQLVDAIHESARDLGVPGFDPLYGYGRGEPDAIP